MAAYQNIALPDDVEIETVDLSDPDALRTFVRSRLLQEFQESHPEIVAAPLVVWVLGTEQIRIYQKEDLFALALSAEKDTCRDSLKRAAIAYVQSFSDKKTPFVHATLIMSSVRNAYFPVRVPRTLDSHAEHLGKCLPSVVSTDLLSGIFHISTGPDHISGETITLAGADARVSIIRGGFGSSGTGTYLLTGMVYVIRSNIAYTLKATSGDSPVTLYQISRTGEE